MTLHASLPSLVSLTSPWVSSQLVPRFIVQTSGSTPRSLPSHPLPSSLLRISVQLDTTRMPLFQTHAFLQGISTSGPIAYLLIMLTVALSSTSCQQVWVSSPSPLCDRLFARQCTPCGHLRMSLQQALLRS